MLIIKVILFFFLFWLTTPSAFCEIGEINPHFPRIANCFGTCLSAGSWPEAESYWQKIDLFIGGSWSFAYDWDMANKLLFMNSTIEDLTKNIITIKQNNPNAIVLPYVDPAEAYSLVNTIPESWYKLDVNGQRMKGWPGTDQINTSIPEPLQYNADKISNVIATKDIFDGMFVDVWKVDNILIPELVKLRDGNFIVMCNGWNLPNENFDKTNGAMAEDEINRVIDGEVDFENFLNRYIRWTTECIKPTVTTIVCSPRGVETDPAVFLSWTPEQQQQARDNAQFLDLKTMRFGLTTTLMGDGYFAFDYGVLRGDWWWYPEYDAPLGYPKGVAYKNSNGTWQRDYEGGTVIVNGTNYDAVIKLSPPHTDVSTGEISQHFTLPSFDGRIYTLKQSSGCTYSIDLTNANYSSSGGTGSVNVTTSDNQCSWTATSNESWITITSGDSGTGNGTVSFSVMANMIQSSRTGTMSIAGETFTVIQDGACIYYMIPTNESFGSSEGTGSINVTTQSGCTWNASSDASWVTITSGSNGTGSGTVNYSVSANTSAIQRTGMMTIAGQTFTVTQSGITCTYNISSTSQSFDSSGGTGNVSVTTQTGCSWTAISKNSWITITSGSSGTGNGTVAYSVSANTSTSQRTGEMTIAGQTFTVTQSGKTCTYNISSTSQSFDSSGGTGNVNVTASSTNCTWNASSDASWVTITSGSSGTGSGTVNYSVSANTSAIQRTGMMTIAGQTFTVTQSAGSTCTYSISPTRQSFDANVGNSGVYVTASAECAWTATSNASWISITSGSSGTGSSAVNYSISANTNTSSRTGIMTIAGQTFTVTQQGTTCTYTIAPSNQSYNSNGGTGNVSITTQSNCAWTAQSNTTWITITSGSIGTGNGTVSFSVMANMIQSSRTGTMSIAGDTFTVIQEGVQQAECSTWTEVINKHTAYVSGQADWSDVITCYTLYAVSQ